jgi:predicted RNase H-like nuclease
MACSRDGSGATVYIGIDLAWSARNLSGAAALAGSPSGARLAGPPALLGDLDEVAAFVARAAGDGPAIVAVDAPLLVPNATGCRPAESALGAAFRAFEAGAHPANRRLLDRGEGVRGELLVERLAALGFRHVSAVGAGEGGRLVTEVYPHAALVAIFGLARTLKYKARPGRSAETRRAEWRRYQALLLSLGAADPPLAGHDELLAADVAALRGRALKSYEDRVDALMCAYVALYAHRWGAARCKTFGDMQTGYIFTPVILPS